MSESKKEALFLSHCSVSRLHPLAHKAACEFLDAQAREGVVLYNTFNRHRTRFRRAFAELMKCQPKDIAFTVNTASALGFVSSGYPFQKGDKIISYVHEYPSNYYPWMLAAKKHELELDLIPDSDPEGNLPTDRPRGFNLADLESRIDRRTKIVALSHVQFTSGFAADLQEIGDLCRQKGVDLVIDAAQSLGSLPVYPEKWGISAVASSGWKWLLGPGGSGVFYTSEEFRDKLEFTIAGPDMMKQGFDYLDHSWTPKTDAQTLRV